MRMLILNNPWIVGIGAGILSGIIVAVVTRWLFSRRDEKEYAQRLKAANKEILYAIRPGVSEGVIPEKPIIKSLIRSTSEKYSVNYRDLYNVQNIADELIKEIMDSSFISAQAKQEFCCKLFPLIEEEKSRKESSSITKEAAIAKRYRFLTVTMLSLMTGMFTILLSGILSLELDPSIFTKYGFVLIVPSFMAVVLAFFISILKRNQQVSLKLRGLKTINDIRKHVKD